MRKLRSKKGSNFPEAIQLVDSGARIQTQDSVSRAQKKCWVRGKHTLLLTTEKAQHTRQTKGHSTTPQRGCFKVIPAGSCALTPRCGLGSDPSGLVPFAHYHLRPKSQANDLPTFSPMAPMSGAQPVRSPPFPESYLLVSSHPPKRMKMSHDPGHIRKHVMGSP